MQIKAKYSPFKLRMVSRLSVDPEIAKLPPPVNPGSGETTTTTPGYPTWLSAKIHLLSQQVNEKDGTVTRPLSREQMEFYKKWGFLPKEDE